jgi:hypothetical protein
VISFDDLTVDQICRLLDVGLFPFATCPNCKETQPVQPDYATGPLTYACCVCAGQADRTSLQFLDRVAAEELTGWQVGNVELDPATKLH